MVDWKKELDKETLSFVNKIIFDTGKHKKAFAMSGRPATTQLLIATALLYKHIYDLELKISFLEKALKEISGKKAEGEKLGGKKLDYELEREEMALKEAESIIQELMKGQKDTKKQKKKTKKKAPLKSLSKTKKRKKK